jgi:hypothetical protein
VVAILEIPELAVFTLVYGLVMKVSAITFMFVARAMLAEPSATPLLEGK